MNNEPLSNEEKKKIMKKILSDLIAEMLAHPHDWLGSDVLNQLTHLANDDPELDRKYEATMKVLTEALKTIQKGLSHAD